MFRDSSAFFFSRNEYVDGRERKWMNKKPFDDPPPPSLYFFDKFSHRVALVSVSGNLSGRMPLRFVVSFQLGGFF